jgi:hypothetical protein
MHENNIVLKIWCHSGFVIKNIKLALSTLSILTERFIDTRRIIILTRRPEGGIKKEGLEETFLSPIGTRFDRCHFKAQNSLYFQGPPLSMAPVMDLPASKSLRINNRWIYS